MVGLSHFDGSDVEAATKKLIDTVMSVTAGKQWGRYVMSVTAVKQWGRYVMCVTAGKIIGILLVGSSGVMSVTVWKQ